MKRTPMEMSGIDFLAHVYPDWTILEIPETGQVYGFRREDGRVCRVPHPDCPFIPVQWPDGFTGFQKP